LSACWRLAGIVRPTPGVQPRPPPVPAQVHPLPIYYKIVFSVDQAKFLININDAVNICWAAFTTGIVEHAL
jgi:hypothetical protein